MAKRTVIPVYRNGDTIYVYDPEVKVVVAFSKVFHKYYGCNPAIRGVNVRNLLKDGVVLNNVPEDSDSEIRTVIGQSNTGLTLVNIKGELSTVEKSGIQDLLDNQLLNYLCIRRGCLYVRGSEPSFALGIPEYLKNEVAEGWVLRDTMEERPMEIKEDGVPGTTKTSEKTNVDVSNQTTNTPVKSGIQSTKKPSTVEEFEIPRCAVVSHKDSVEVDPETIEDTPQPLKKPFTSLHALAMYNQKLEREQQEEEDLKQKKFGEQVEDLAKREQNIVYREQLLREREESLGLAHTDPTETKPETPTPETPTNETNTVEPIEGSVNAPISLKGFLARLNNPDNGTNETSLPCLDTTEQSNLDDIVPQQIYPTDEDKKDLMPVMSYVGFYQNMLMLCKVGDIMTIPACVLPDLNFECLKILASTFSGKRRVMIVRLRVLGKCDVRGILVVTEDSECVSFQVMGSSFDSDSRPIVDIELDYYKWKQSRKYLS